MKNAKDNDSAIHFMGLLSDGGVHSHNTPYGLEMAREGLKRFIFTASWMAVIHLRLPVKDTLRASGKIE